MGLKKSFIPTKIHHMVAQVNVPPSLLNIWLLQRGEGLEYTGWGIIHLLKIN